MWQLILQCKHLGGWDKGTAKKKASLGYVTRLSQNKANERKAGRGEEVNSGGQVLLACGVSPHTAAQHRPQSLFPTCSILSRFSVPLTFNPITFGIHIALQAVGISPARGHCSLLLDCLPLTMGSCSQMHTLLPLANPWSLTGSQEKGKDPGSSLKTPELQSPDKPIRKHCTKLSPELCR